VLCRTHAAHAAHAASHAHAAARAGTAQVAEAAAVQFVVVVPGAVQRADVPQVDAALLRAAQLPER
jgi:hypothetical protein